MSHDHEGGLDRRQTLKCMLWAGTGVVWTVAGGVPSSRLIGSAKAAEASFSFVQMSDCHIGFAKPANPDAHATLNVAIDKVLAMPDRPAFMIHTGDISHSAKANEFDDAQQMIGRAKLDVHYSPGEHDILDPKTRTPISSASARGRPAEAGIPSIRAACILCRSTMSSTSRRTASVRSAQSSSNGWKAISKASRIRRRLSSFAISRFG
jgi:hypothetical protein